MTACSKNDICFYLLELVWSLPLCTGSILFLFKNWVNKSSWRWRGMLCNLIENWSTEDIHASRLVSSHVDLFMCTISTALQYHKISLSIPGVSLSLTRSHCIIKWELGLIAWRYSFPLPWNMFRNRKGRGKKRKKIKKRPQKHEYLTVSCLKTGTGAQSRHFLWILTPNLFCL